MAKHLNVPLYQDNSSFGKAVSFIIRFWWIGVGSVISLLGTIPFFILGLILIIIPIIPVLQFINWISQSL